MVTCCNLVFQEALCPSAFTSATSVSASFAPLRHCRLTDFVVLGRPSTTQHGKSCSDQEGEGGANIGNRLSFQREVKDAHSTRGRRERCLYCSRGWDWLVMYWPSPTKYGVTSKRYFSTCRPIDRCCKFFTLRPSDFPFSNGFGMAAPAQQNMRMYPAHYRPLKLHLPITFQRWRAAATGCVM